MRKLFFAASLLLGLSVLFSSCEKEGGVEGGKSSGLNGDYVCQKVEITFTNGKTRTITDKEDWVKDDDYDFFKFVEQDYILFDYEMNFTNSRYKYKTNYTDSLMDGGSYSIKDGYLYLGFMGLEAAPYKIATNSGNTLVLEATEDYISLANLSNELYGASRSIKKTTATYKRQ